MIDIVIIGTILFLLFGVSGFLSWEVFKLKEENIKNKKTQEEMAVLLLELSKVSSSLYDSLREHANILKTLAKNNTTTHTELSQLRVGVEKFMSATNELLSSALKSQRSANVFNPPKKNDKIKPN